MTGALDANTLTDYISYARKTYARLNDEAAELVEEYVDMHGWKWAADHHGGRGSSVARRLASRWRRR